MPRFRIPSSSYEDPVVISQEEEWRVMGGRHINGDRINRPPASVRLMCLSPDGRTVHSLAGKSFIETNGIHLEQEGREDTEDVIELPSLIRTKMPERVRAALEIDPPVELLCVEGESPPRCRSESDRRQNLPRLCLYTRKTAFLLQLAYTKPNTNSSAPVMGHVVSVTEPFEQYLDISFATTIVRIRPAPQLHDGYATLCPAASMAMLTVNKDINEYALLLHHSDGRVTTPLSFGIEALVEQQEEGEAFVDFCFAQSNSLSLFPSFSVLLLKGCGDVLAASPFIFDGTVVAKSVVDEALDYLEGQLESKDRSKAAWRQCRAAQQYLLDVFVAAGGADPRSHFCTVKLDGRSADWPVQLQGPILFHSQAEPGPSALAIENFGKSDLVGIAIGIEKCQVDFAVLSPTSLLPRFAFESPNDSYDLDDALFKLGALVKRVAIDTANTQGQSNGSISLLQDPVVFTLLHCATPTSVISISTTAIRVACLRLQGRSMSESPRTTAWSCLDTATGLTGIVVSGDSHLGHQLIGRTEDGSMVPVNVTETQYLHEMESLLKEASEQRERSLTNIAANAPDVALSLESTPPLVEAVGPLATKVNAGLAKMGKVIGSETSYKDITPDSLAVAIQVKERCDKEIVLPLLELKKVVDARRESLKSMLKSQRGQFEDLQAKITDLKDGMSSIGAMMETAESNAVTLSQRSAAALQASQDLLPTITQAEYDFFQDMKRLEAKCSFMENQMKQLTEAISSRASSTNDSTCDAATNTMNSEDVTRANALLRDQGNRIEVIRERLNEAESRMDLLLSRSH